VYSEFVHTWSKTDITGFGLSGGRDSFGFEIAWTTDNHAWKRGRSPASLQC
jgi:hypothetical protein